MKVLCVTHSSRPFVERRSSLNALSSRFGSDRLKNLPSLESLPGVDAAVPFTGMLSLWKVVEGPEPSLQFLSSYDPGFKVQSAAFRGDRLLVCGSDRLEILDASLTPTSTIRDNWIAGGHTVFVDTEGYAWLTSAPANAILRVDIDSGVVVERLPLPNMYGVGYDIKPHHDLRRHFVPTDSQPTHVNCAYPTDAGILVTLLIPGAVGVYDHDRSYREIVRGFRGCHGGKLDPDRSEIYLTDSPAGLIWFFDATSAEIKGRLKVESHWLHDAHLLSNDLLAAAPSDRNAVLLVERSSGRVLFSQECHSLGASVMFVSAFEVGDSWQQALAPVKPSARRPGAKLGKELLPPVATPHNWSGVAVSGARVTGHLGIECSECRTEYLVQTKSFWLDKGRYRLSGRLNVATGGVSVGLLDIASQTWLGTIVFDELRSSDSVELQLEKHAEVQLVFSGNNAPTPGPVAADVIALSLRPIYKGEGKV